MYKIYCILLIILVLIITGCKKDPEVSVNPEILRDRDSLLSLIKHSDDFNAITYSDLQLKNMKNQKDYKKVLFDFTKNELKEEIETFQTVSNTVNPRWVVVTTKSQKVYYISLKKLYNYNEIWTIDSYTEFRWKTYPLNLGYKLLKIQETGGKLEEWLKNEMKLPGWRKEIFQMGGKTYVLIKTSSRSSDSVELEDVTSYQGSVEILYQTFDYKTISEYTKPLINDYILIQINSTEVESPIQFVNTYTNIKE